jgi:alkylhydroperoxidase family enzyme
VESVTSRIAPVDLADGDPAVEELLAPLGERSNSNFFRTLVRHPRIYKRWIPYGHGLLNGSLPARDRELLVLRAAHRVESFYEWSHHEPIASSNGLTDEEIARVRLGPDEEEWSDFDATVLRAADELIDSHTLSDKTWQLLRRRYDERQMIEVPMVVGFYFSMGFALNSFGVQLEPEISNASD